MRAELEERRRRSRSRRSRSRGRRGRWRWGRRRFELATEKGKNSCGKQERQRQVQREGEVTRQLPRDMKVASVTLKSSTLASTGHPLFGSITDICWKLDGNQASAINLLAQQNQEVTPLFFRVFFLLCTTFDRSQTLFTASPHLFYVAVWSTPVAAPCVAWRTHHVCSKWRVRFCQLHDWCRVFCSWSSGGPPGYSPSWPPWPSSSLSALVLLQSIILLGAIFRHLKNKTGQYSTFKAISFFVFK